MSAATTSIAAAVERHPSVASDRHRLARDLGRVAVDGTSQRSRSERAVGLVGAVGERFGGDGQPERSPLADELGTREPDQDDGSEGRQDDLRDRPREPSVRGGAVVQRAVWLHVTDRDAHAPGDRVDREQLLGERGPQLRIGEVEVAATEALTVRVPRMRPDRDTVAHSHFQRVLHRVGVAGVCPAGHVHRRHERDEGLIGLLPFPDVRVEVDPGHRHLEGQTASPRATAAATPAPRTQDLDRVERGRRGDEQLAAVRSSEDEVRDRFRHADPTELPPVGIEDMDPVLRGGPDVAVLVHAESVGEPRLDDREEPWPLEGLAIDHVEDKDVVVAIRDPSRGRLAT